MLYPTSQIMLRNRRSIYQLFTGVPVTFSVVVENVILTHVFSEAMVLSQWTDKEQQWMARILSCVPFSTKIKPVIIVLKMCAEEYVKLRTLEIGLALLSTCQRIKPAEGWNRARIQVAILIENYRPGGTQLFDIIWISQICTSMHFYFNITARFETYCNVCAFLLYLHPNRHH